MNRFSRPPRTPAKFSESLHHQINAYCLAATAAGVGMLALAQPAEARIVYTKAQLTIGPNGVYQLDLNHDGINDFGLVNVTHHSATGIGDYLQVEPLISGNEILVQRTNQGYAAAALPSGARVGRGGKQFQAGHDFMAFVSETNESGFRSSGGPWKNVRNRYLGLKFRIKGRTHYGWARLNVAISKHQFEVTAILTGYAYETIPNKPIITGKTHGKDDATLGRLAQGASGISNRGNP
jgi:hypothetical protein